MHHEMKDANILILENNIQLQKWGPVMSWLSTSFGYQFYWYLSLSPQGFVCHGSALHLWSGRQQHSSTSIGQNWCTGHQIGQSCLIFWIRLIYRRHARTILQIDDPSPSWNWFGCGYLPKLRRPGRKLKDYGNKYGVASVLNWQQSK